jgi:hypothetical protein
MRSTEQREKIADTEKREVYFRAQREIEHADEMRFFRRQGTQLKSHLEQFLTSK